MITAARAQIKKGAVLLGGQLGVSAQTGKNDFLQSESTSSGFGISPAFGKAIKENLVIGGDFDFSYNKNSQSNNYSQTSYNYGIGFFVR